MSETSRYLRSKRNGNSLLRFFLRWMEKEHNWYVSPAAVFKKGLILPHNLGGIYIAEFLFNGITIIHQNVTVGSRVSNKREGQGCSNGFLYVGSGAYIASDISIGANVIVGANAVVTKDIPNNSIVIGANKILCDKDNVKINKMKRDILNSVSNYILDPRKRYWPNRANESDKYKLEQEISKLREKFDVSRSKKELCYIEREYKKLLSQGKVSLFQRLTWSKLYRLFTGKWMKTK